MNLLLVNYGTSNINSIYNALSKIKRVNIFINDFNNKNIDKIIFPGQGHIKNCINFLKNIENFFNLIEKKHILGICIGYHIFFKNSEENASTLGFNVIKQKIEKISNDCCENTILPNIGWRDVKIFKNHQIFKNLNNIFKQYFMHSFSNKEKNNYTFGISNFNKIDFNSVIIKENKILFQFHPEKSGKNGLILIKNFLNL